MVEQDEAERAWEASPLREQFTDHAMSARYAYTTGYDDGARAAEGPLRQRIADLDDRLTAALRENERLMRIYVLGRAESGASEGAPLDQGAAEERRGER